MTARACTERVIDLVADQFHILADEVTEKSTLDMLNGDSLDGVEIIMAVEEEFEIDLNWKDVETITTVGELAAAAVGKLGIA
jgi:acyl carrier protein